MSFDFVQSAQVSIVWCSELMRKSKNQKTKELELILTILKQSLKLHQIYW
jgi:hypothetical protein